MPRRQHKHRSRHFLSGFVIGVVLGAFLSLLASNYLKPQPVPLILSGIALFIAYISAWVITVYNAVRGKALITSYVDGLIAGCALSAQTIAWILYGIHIP
jgi:F0F1-type ATP synthase assembly protein I